ncbi:MAG: hypothetical protein KC503_11450, partial [Myxococcales bacterium]|nr:hypothetical protein [Myxococcales bacterium]
IARALLGGASVLLLDEPSSALDARAERHLVVTLERLRATHALLVVAHAPALLACADRVEQLLDGKLSPLSPPAPARDHADVASCHDGVMVGAPS